MAQANVNQIIANTSFSMLRGKVYNPILDAIDNMGFTQPTEIQAKSLPHLLMGKDVIGAAKTGSGKTLAFLVPVIHLLNKLQFQPRHGTGCIILSPTRELALQIFNVLEKLTKAISLTSILVVGGMKKPKECKKLSQGQNIVVATPGRLLDHLRTTDNFNVKNLKVFVMDEADKLLEAGFERDLTAIIKLLPKERQTVLFSATITEKIENLARLAMTGERVYVSVINAEASGSSTVTGLTQGYFICPVQNRITFLFKMLKKTKKQKVMVFFSSCKSVDFHCEFFQTHCQAQVLSIHGRHSQPKRKKTFETFVEAKTGVLFCTDVAARGLDIPLVDWIIQYDPPTDPKEYIHRVGRTARGAEGTGSAVLLLRPEEEAFLTFLKSEKATLDKFTLDDEAEDVQKMLEDLVSNNGVFKTLAKKAYIAFLRSYQAHPMRKVFNINTLDFKAAGKAFGFVDPPQVDMGQLTGANKKRRR